MRLLQNVNGLGDDRVYLGVVLLHVALRQLEERTFSLLHQFVYILGLVESLCLHNAGIRYELTCQIFLSKNLGMILYMCRRCHMRTKLYYVWRTAHILYSTLTLKLVDNGHDVDRILVHRQCLYGIVYLLMTWFVECLRAQSLGHHREGILVNHKRSQHHLLYINSLWLQMAVVLVERLALRLLARLSFCTCIWHKRI